MRRRRRSSIKQSRRPDQTLASSGGVISWSREIGRDTTLSRGEATRLEGGSEHVENTDISVLGGESGRERLHLVSPAICHYKGDKSPPSSDCYRPCDGNRIQRQTEAARVLLSSSGRRLMKHPAVKITPAGRRSRPSVAALIVSRRRRSKYRCSNYRPCSTSAT